MEKISRDNIFRKKLFDRFHKKFTGIKKMIMLYNVKFYLLALALITISITGFSQQTKIVL
jgi:hypothetical protein